MQAIIITKEMGGRTAKMFERLGIDFKYCACECQRGIFDEDKTIFYKCKGWHGSSLARLRALEVPDSVVFDDDYTNIMYGGMADTDVKSKNYKDGQLLLWVLGQTKKIEEKYDKLILGGYSGGALSGAEGRFKQNIMQVFFGGRANMMFRDDSDLYRLNDDVCGCIRAKKRGMLTLGLWSFLRACQQPEGEDNTNNYDSRSWAKSYLPILYAPTAARVVWCKAKKLSNGKTRPGRFHHVVQWSKITPKIVDKI